MITENFTIILYITGIITSSLVGAVIAPRLVIEKIMHLKVGTGFDEILARHWAGTAFITGLLLIWAGYDPAIRIPVVTCVGLDKAIFVGMLFLNYKKDYVRRLALVCAFDTACVIVYLLYLMGWA